MKPLMEAVFSEESRLRNTPLWLAVLPSSAKVSFQGSVSKRGVFPWMPSLAFFAHHVEKRFFMREGAKQVLPFVCHTFLCFFDVR